MRKRYDKTFKAKVALEALCGDKTVQELASPYEVHPNIVTLWKKQLFERAEVLFEKPGKDTERHELEQKQDELYKQIGKFQIENEFLKKSTKVLGVSKNSLRLSRFCISGGYTGPVFP